jgi:hypothetical protein
VYGPLPNNGCFSASTVPAFSKYATILLAYSNFCCQLFSSTFRRWYNEPAWGVNKKELGLTQPKRKKTIIKWRFHKHTFILKEENEAKKLILSSQQ